MADFGFDDSIGVPPEQVVGDLIRSQPGFEDVGRPVDPATVVNRLIRKAGQVPVERAQRPERPQKIGEDFSSFGAPDEAPHESAAARPAQAPSAPYAPQQPQPTGEDFSSYGQGDEKKDEWGGYGSVIARGLASGAISGLGATSKAVDVLSGGDVGTPAKLQWVLQRAQSLAAGGMEPDAARQQANREMLAGGANKDPRTLPLYRAGHALQKWGEEAIPMTEVERKSRTGRVATGVGAFGGMLPGIAAASAVGGPWAGVAVGAAEMGLSSAGDTFDQAIEKGATVDQAITAAQKMGAVSTVLGAVPLGVVFKPIQKFLPAAGPGVVNWSIRALAHAAESGVIFAGVGEAQEYLAAKIASEYDPKAEYAFDFDRLVSSFLTGAIISGGADAYSALRNRGAQPQPGLPPPGPPRPPPPPPGPPHPDSADPAQANRRAALAKVLSQADHRADGQPVRTQAHFDAMSTADMMTAVRDIVSQTEERGRQQASPDQQQPGPQPGQPPPGPQPSPQPAQPAGDLNAATKRFNDAVTHYNNVASHLPLQDPRRRAAAQEIADARAEMNRLRGQQPAPGTQQAPPPPQQPPGPSQQPRAAETAVPPSEPAAAPLVDRENDLLARAGFPPKTIAALSPEERAAAIQRAAKRLGEPAPTDEAEPAAAPQEPAEPLDEGPRGGAPSQRELHGEPDVQYSYVPHGTGTREDPVWLNTSADVDRAAAMAKEDHTHAQGEANNIQRGHAIWDADDQGHGGIPLTIEAKAGGVRRGLNPETGEPWESTMAAAYGYAKGTEGADSTPDKRQQVDFFIGGHLTGADGRPNRTAYVLDELDRGDGKFRQHKAFIGFLDPKSALAAYLGSTGKTAAEVGGMRRLSADELKDWLRSPEETKTPISDAVNNAPQATEKAGEPVKAGPEEKAPETAAATGATPKVAETAQVPEKPEEAGKSTRIEPHHHDAIEGALRAAGVDPNTVAPRDIARGAEIMGQEGRDPADAFQLGVVRGLVEDGHLTNEEVRNIYGNDIAKATLLAAQPAPQRGVRAEAPSAGPGRQAPPTAAEQPQGGRGAGAPQHAGAEAAQTGEAEGTTAAVHAEPHPAGEAAGSGPERGAPRGVEPAGVAESPGRTEATEPGERAGGGETPRAATEAGEQGVIAGAEKIGEGEQAQRGAEKPLAPKVPQKEAGGLFGDESKQTDLVDMARQPPKDAAGDWWRGDLTPMGRELAVKAAGLPAGVAKMRWHYISPDEQAKLAAIRGTDDDPMMHAEAPTWAEVLHALPKDAKGDYDFERSGDLMREISGKKRVVYNDLTPSQKQEMLARLKGETPRAKGWEQIGKNPIGQTIYEDQRGVRSYIENGVRTTEPVAVRPTRAGVEMGVEHREPFLLEGEGAKDLKAQAKADGFDTSTDYWHGTTQKPFTTFKDSPVKNDVLGPAVYLSKHKAGAEFYGPGRGGTMLGPFWVRGNIVKPDTLVPFRLNADGTPKGKPAPAIHAVSLLKDQLTGGLPREPWGADLTPSQYAREFMKRRGVDGYDSGAGLEVAIYDPANVRAGFEVAPPKSKAHIPTEEPTHGPGDVSAGNAGAEPAGVPPAGEERPARGDRGAEGARGGEPLPADHKGTAGREGAPSAEREDRGGGARPGDDAGIPLRDLRESRPDQQPVHGPADHVTGANFVIRPGDLREDRGWKQKATDNVRALELAKQIEAEGRPATLAEQRELALYVGWGGIKGAFPDSDGNFAKGYEDIGRRIKDALSREDYATARRSIQYAHYTGEPVVRAMWKAVERIAGDHWPTTVFEPGMGTGNFAGMMPKPAQYQGIEFDATTARIAKLLYPLHGVQHADFTRIHTPKDAFDVAIGNPPFADVAIKVDPQYPQGFLMHDYFFAKSLDAVRPGGVLAFISSAGTMNKVDTAARDYLADRADLLGAIRLPGNAFEKNAGTSVTTDIIFLRKRLPGEKAGDRTWTETVERDLPTKDGGTKTGAVNRYFAEHPEMVLGEEGFFDKLYPGRYAVQARKGVDFVEALDKAVEALPAGEMSADAREAGPTLDMTPPEQKDGSFYLKDGKLYQKRDGAGAEVQQRGSGVSGGRTANEIERIKGLVPIRDALRDVYAADLANDAAAGERTRKELNRHYDAFVSKFGPINKADLQRRRPTSIQEEQARAEAREEARYAGEPFDEGSFDPSKLIQRGETVTAIARARKAAKEEALVAKRPWDEGAFDPDEMEDVIIDRRPNVDAFMDDPESYRLRAIEYYDDASGAVEKAPVFRENVLKRERAPEIRSVNDAVLHVLNQTGRLDIPQIARLYHKSESEVIDELGERIFRDPTMPTTWTMRDEYLSGNVRKKLAIARAAAERNPELRRNVEALEAAIPPNIPPSQIRATLGMPWIPTDVVESFGTDHLGLEKLKVTYIPKLAQWVVSGDADSAAASQAFGTDRRRAPALISDVLNRQPIKIYDTIRNPDGSNSSVLNVEATQAAADKATEIAHKFSDWIWSEPARAERLSTHYNENYNNLVVRQYDGSYLTTPGVSADFHWRPHQTGVISRIVLAGNTYMAHAVGAGKTSAMIGAGMELRRLGLARKPMYAVPNHMLAQFTKEFYWQYPTARIAVADERRFHTDRRKQFIADVANDDLDAVIITHSAFGMIPISDGFADGVIQREVDEYRDLLANLPKDQDSRITRSRIEKQIERLEQRLAGRGNKRRDQVFTFEEMGVDHLFVDEAHLFRKLDFATNMGQLKGISPEGSQMAWDLYVKSLYLDTLKPGRGLVLASGTPITNTMAELYTVSRYLQPQELEGRGLSRFDAWAGAFGEPVSELEQDAAGGYKMQTRFANFVNVPELSAMVRQVMDVVTSKQLEQYVVRPQLKGGKRQMNLAERSPALTSYQRVLQERMKKIQERKGPPKKGDDIMLSVINDGRHAAIDMRLVDPTLKSDKGSKLSLLVDNAFDIWKRTKAQKFYAVKDGAYDTSRAAAVGPAAQLIFANLGLNRAGFNVPDFIRNELVRRGVPRNEIAFIKDFKTHVAKQRLFNDVREGKVRILVGSTAKMATGVNVQPRLYAIHNLDPLWFPSDDEQRNGRGIRQGNMNPEIEIHDYSTKGTYDSTMWGMMARKARFIQGFFEGDPSLRDMEDLGEASQYEQARAMTTADPRLIKLTELKQDIERANRRKSAFESEHYALLDRRRQTSAAIARHTAEIAQIRKDISQRVDTAGDDFQGEIQGRTFDKRQDFGEALIKAMRTLEIKANLGKHIKVGNTAGFPISVSIHTGMMQGGEPTFWADPSLLLNGGRERTFQVSASPLGVVRSVESVPRGFERDIEGREAEIAKGKKFLAESAKAVDAEFTGDDEIKRLGEEVRKLAAEMAAPPPAPVATDPASISSLDALARIGRTASVAEAEHQRGMMADRVTRALGRRFPEMFDSLEPMMEDARAQPGVNTARLARLLGPKLYGEPTELTSVSLKEMFQNGFDAVKAAIDRGTLKKGRIDVELDDKKRTVVVRDNGIGMTPEVLGKEFFQIAGTSKETERASGGLGIAKMLFMFGNDDIEVMSLRDGVFSHVKTTGPALFDALEDPSKAPMVRTRSVGMFGSGDIKKLFPDGHGTYVRVTIPKTYRDPSSGQEKAINFPHPNSLAYEVLDRSPLFSNIEVTRNGHREPNIGASFPADRYTRLADVKFDWGDARIYVSKDKNAGEHGNNAHVLSNGLWQFSKQVKSDPFDIGSPAVPHTFYIDVSPRVKPEDFGYPFDLNRQGFAKVADDEFKSIMSYLGMLFRQESLDASTAKWGEIHYLDRSEAGVRASAPLDLVPKIERKHALAQIKPGDKIVVHEGKLTVNGREIPVLTPEDVRAATVTAEDLRIPQEHINPDRVMLHSNLSVPDGKGGHVSIATAARARFGKRFDDFVFQVGDAFRQLRDTVVDEMHRDFAGFGDQTDALIHEITSTLQGRREGGRYDALRRGGIGVSFDKEYRGVSIRLPFSGSFINPALPEYTDPRRAAAGIVGTMVHELSHHQVRSHDANFPAEMQRILIALDTSPTFDFPAFKRGMMKTVSEHQDVFDYLNKAAKHESARTIGNRFTDARTDAARDGGSAAQLERTGTGPEVRPSAEGAAPVEDHAGVPGQSVKMAALPKGLYSAVENVVRDTPRMDSARPDQWMGLLRNKPGIKQEELRWLGLPEWLGQHTGPVSRQEVLDYIRANQIELKEVTKGGGGKEVLLPRDLSEWKSLGEREAIEGTGEFEAKYKTKLFVPPGYEEEHTGIREVVDQKDGTTSYEVVQDGYMLNSWDNLNSAIDDLSGVLSEDGEGGTKFGGYRLPGGENYREMLMTLPPKAMEPVGDRYYAKEDAPDDWNVYDRETGEPTRYGTMTHNREWAESTARSLNTPPGPPAFTASHWSEPNVLAHVRFDDRTGPNGERILHVAEIQSDLHQRGREHGYAIDEDRMRELRAEMDDANTDFKLKSDRGDDARDEMERYRAARDAYDEANARVPDLPFKTSWPDLIFKRMLRHASENGYDRLTWDTGDTQNARYDLSQHVDQIHWFKKKDGTFDLLFHANEDGGGTLGEHHGVTAQRLGEIVGQDLADKIMNGEGQEKKYFNNPNIEALGILKGADLQVGGEGQREFYDKILPSIARNLVRPFGGEVGRGTMAIPLEGVLSDEDAAAVNRGAKFRNVGVHSVAITPAMRQGIMDKGFPVFMGSATTGGLRPSERRGVIEAINGIIARQLGDGRIKTEFTDRPFPFGETAGYGGHHFQTADASYLTREHVIKMALDTRSPRPLLERMFHESWHAIEDFLLQDHEMALLKREMPAIRSLAAKHPAYGRMARDLADYEARAFAYQQYAADREAGGTGTNSGLHVGIRQIFERILRLLRQIRNWLTGHGFQSFEDIFGRAHAGEYRGRETRPGSRIEEEMGTSEPKMAREAGLPGDRPVSSHVDPAAIKAHPDYDLAKAGDAEAALRLVADTVKPETIEAAAKQFGPDAIYVPVVAQEATGPNMIPSALAEFYAARAGGTAAEDIHQITRAYHTGANAMERMIARPQFSGPVVPSGKYVVVDDVTVMGSTLAELAHHIQAQGGTVVGAVTLVNAARGGVLSPKQKQIDEIRRRFGDTPRQLFGVDPAALSGPEATYLLNFRDADALRARAATAARQRGERLSAKGVAAGSPVEGGRALFMATPPPHNPTQNARIRDRIADILSGELATKFIEHFSNLSHRVKILQNEVEARANGLTLPRPDIHEPINSTLPSGQQFYAAKRLFPGRVGYEVARFNKAHLDPLIGYMREHGIVLKDAGDYLYAKHADERNRALAHLYEPTHDFQRALHDPDVVGASGMSENEAVRIMDRLERKHGRAIMDGLADRVDAIREFNLDTLERYGLETLSTLAAWRQTYEHYVPLRGWEDAPEDAPPNYGIGGKFNVRGPEVRKALGRGSKADNPLVNLLDQSYRFIERGERNRYLTSLDAALSNLPPDARADIATLNRGRQKRVIDPNTGMVTTQNDFADRHRPEAVHFKLRGQSRYMVFHDATIADAVKRMNPYGLGPLSFVLNWTNRLKSLWTHYSPEFLLRHFGSRYPIEGLLNSQELRDTGDFSSSQYIKDAAPVWGRATRAILAVEAGNFDPTNPLHRYWQEMQRQGGAMMFRSMRDTDLLREHLRMMLRETSTGPVRSFFRRWRQTIEGIDYFTNAMDNSLRLAVYSQAREQGMERQQAAVRARDATIDYQLRAKFSKILGTIIPFYNTAVRTGTRMVGAFGRSKAIRRTFLAVIGTSIALALWNYLVGGDDTDGTPMFEKVPPWDRRMNIIIMNPFDHDSKGRVQPIKIPLPYNWAFPFNIGNTIVGSVIGKEGLVEHLKSLFKSAMVSFTPVGETENPFDYFTPELLRSPAHILENRTWTGSMLHRDAVRQKAPNAYSSMYGPRAAGQPWETVAQAVNTATGGSRVHSGLIDFHPEDYREIFDQFFGAQRRFGMKVYNTGAAIAKGQQPNPMDVPMLSVVRGSDYDKADAAAAARRKFLSTHPWLR